MKKTTRITAILSALAVSMFAAFSLAACVDDTSDDNNKSIPPAYETIEGERVVDAAAWQRSIDFSDAVNISMVFDWIEEPDSGKGSGPSHIEAFIDGNTFYSDITLKNGTEKSRTVSYTKYADGNLYGYMSDGESGKWTKGIQENRSENDYKTVVSSFILQIIRMSGISSLVTADNFANFSFDETENCYVWKYSDNNSDLGYWIKIQNGKCVYAKAVSSSPSNPELITTVILNFYDFGATHVNVPDSVIKNAVEH